MARDLVAGAPILSPAVVAALTVADYGDLRPLPSRAPAVRPPAEAPRRARESRSKQWVRRAGPSGHPTVAAPSLSLRERVSESE